MKASNKWLIWMLVVMLISFIFSGFFFLKSGMLNLEDGTANKEVILDIEIFNAKMNKMMGISLDEQQKELLILEESINNP